MVERKQGEWVSLLHKAISTHRPENQAEDKECVLDPLERIKMEFRLIIAALGPQDGVKVLTAFLNDQIDPLQDLVLRIHRRGEPSVESE